MSTTTVTTPSFEVVPPTADAVKIIEATAKAAAIAKVKEDAKALKDAAKLAKAALAEAAKAAKDAAAAAKAAKAQNVLAVQIMAAADKLGLVTKKYANDGAFVIRLPEWAAFKAKLPEGDEGKELAQLFFNVTAGINQITGGCKATFILRRTGKFTLYSELAK